MASLRPFAFLVVLTAGAAQAQDLPAMLAPPKPDVATEVPPCRPRSLVSMTVRNITPGLQAADPRAQPRRMWRLGATYLRSLEQPVISPALQDPKAPMARQSLMIVAEPDIWIIDTASRQARHSLDKGPVFEVRAPILPLGDTPLEFRTLEYGCEAEFVAVRAPIAQKTVRWGGVDAAIHTYVVGTASLAILMDDRAGEPLMITYLRDQRPVLVIRYDEYRQGLPEQPELFRPPADVQITEASDVPGARPLD